MCRLRLSELGLYPGLCSLVSHSAVSLHMVHCMLTQVFLTSTRFSWFFVYITIISYFIMCIYQYIHVISSFLIFFNFLSLPLFPFVRGEVPTSTSSLPHLIVFSTVLCLLSSSSSLPPLLSSSLLSLHSPPISVLASLVSSCPAYATLPLSSVVSHPPFFLCVLPTVVCNFNFFKS